MLLVMNLQQSLAAGPWICLELAAPVRALCLGVRRSFLARFPAVGRAYANLQDRASWLHHRPLVLVEVKARERTPTHVKETVPGLGHSSEKTSGI